MEYAVMTPKRTEYGRSIRRMYENGQIKESWGNLLSLVPRTDGMANTLTTVAKDNILREDDGNKVRMRFLTSLECWRLQAFPDEAYYKAIDAGTGEHSAYRQAGNTITVTVLQSIFEGAFIEKRWEKANTLSNWGM